ncbi:MAG: hypothetical protein HC888_12225 [Candidatus Competibacteraceae bacterium]|nr:hypothetical protein [Candidatus Competibacteraceae bacterium]
MPTAEVPAQDIQQKRKKPISKREAVKLFISSLTPLQASFRSARGVNTPLIAITSSDPAITITTIMEATNEPRMKDASEVACTPDGAPIYDQVPAVQWDVVRGLQPVNQLGILSIAQVLGLPIGDNPNIENLEKDVRKKGSLMVNPSEMLRKSESLPPNTIVFMLQAHRYLEGNDSNMKIVAQGIWTLRDEFKTTIDSWL